MVSGAVKPSFVDASCCNELVVKGAGACALMMDFFVFDTTKIKRELGWMPTKTNEEMLLTAYNYYHNNREEILSRKDVSAHSSVAKMGIIRVIKWFC